MTEQIPDWQGGIDPYRWAREFCDHFTVTEPASDGSTEVVGGTLDLMVSWFHQAIEAGRGVGKGEGWDEAQAEYDLTVPQRRRATALTLARQAVGATGLASTSLAVDSMELVSIAAWIIDGEEAPAESYVRAIPRYVDTELPEPDAEGRDGPDYDRAAGDEGR